MKTMLQTDQLASFPFDAESDRFFSAMASTLTYVLGLTDHTPFWCGMNRTYCIHCGRCSGSVMQKHQRLMYHSLLAATGVAYAFDYPEDDSVLMHTLPGVEKGWRWPDAFIDFIMRFAGLEWRRLSPKGGKTQAVSSVKASIDEGFPVLVRLGGRDIFGPDTAWQIIAGYDGDAVVGLDSCDRSLSDSGCHYTGDGLFIMDDWHERMLDAVVITGRRPADVTIGEILDRSIEVLTHPARDKLEAEILHLIDTAGPNNAQQRADMLGKITGVPIEARWHTAEAYDSIESPVSVLLKGSGLWQSVRDQLFDRYIHNDTGETHGVCWKIWAALGIGPETGLQTPADAGQRLCDIQNKETLKELFQRVFQNDREVLGTFRAIRQQVN